MSGQTLNRMDSKGVLAAPDECEVCEEEYTFGGWRIQHGFAACGNCGITHRIVDYDDDNVDPGIVVTDEFMEIVADFYDEHERRYDYADRFNEWLEDNHPEFALE